MRKIITRAIVCLLTVLALAACGANSSSLEKEVKNRLNDQLKGTGVKVSDITLVHQEGNYFTGSVTLTDGSEKEDYEINVTFDGRAFQYEIPDFIDE